jgi:hypothetical protein
VKTGVAESCFAIWRQRWFLKFLKCERQKVFYGICFGILRSLLMRHKKQSTLADKAVPLRHAGAKGRGDITPTHYWPQHCLGIGWGWVVIITPWQFSYLQERTLGTHWIGDWVGLRTDLDTVTRWKIRCVCRKSNTGINCRECMAGYYAFVGKQWIRPYQISAQHLFALKDVIKLRRMCRSFLQTEDISAHVDLGVLSTVT